MMDDKIRIQWSPGHMIKAKREVQEKLNIVDMVTELWDAYIPSTSENPMVEKLCRNESRLIVPPEKDRADAAAIKLRYSTLRSGAIHAVVLDTPKENIIVRIVGESRLLMQTKTEHMKRGGIRPRAIRAMVIGVLNVGKPTFINRISKKKAAVTRGRPGVTRAPQRLKVNQNLELLDTPGMLQSRFEDEAVGVLLTIMGTVRDEILPLEGIAVWVMRYLITDRKRALQQRYGIVVYEDPYIMLERTAEKCGFMRKGEIDKKHTTETSLRELQDDKLGRIT